MKKKIFLAILIFILTITNLILFKRYYDTQTNSNEIVNNTENTNFQN